MKTLRLIHWNEAEAHERAARLQKYGYDVQWQVRTGPELLAELKTMKVSAVVIDLERLPSHGRDVAVYLRRLKSTRHVPIVFVGGEASKVARLKELLPDASYTTWPQIQASLDEALAQPPAAPVVPASVFAPYANRPVAAKLGIRAGAVVALLHPPPDFLQTLGEGSRGVTFVTRIGRDVSLAMWFVRSRRELDARTEAVAARVGEAPLWIAWPKRIAGSTSDVTQQDVRRAGLAAGLVDYKICSIDATWSALLFRRRRKMARLKA
jgi:CheY-like chemotaxis protein